MELEFWFSIYIYFCIPIILVLLVITYVYLVKKPDENKLEQKATQHYEEKRYEEAIFIYDKILKFDSENVRIWNKKGLCFYNLNQHAKALFCYDKALKIDPNFIFALRNKGISLFSLDRDEEALSCFCKILEIDPNSEIDLKYKNDLLRIQEEKRKREEEEAKRKAEEKRRQEDEEARIKAEEKRKQEEELKEIARKKSVFETNLKILIREIELSADESPCPTCNELDVLIVSLSPNARSVLVRCKNCRREYRIKLAPDDPKKLVSLFNSLLDGKDLYSPYSKDDIPFWRMKIKNSQYTNQRKPIPSSVKRAVWKRDGGRCVKCGSQENLEYDHIIPVSKGGSNTARNIQLLCEKCNRSKGANII